MCSIHVKENIATVKVKTRSLCIVYSVKRHVCTNEESGWEHDSLERVFCSSFVEKYKAKTKLCFYGLLHHHQQQSQQIVINGVMTANI